MIQFDTSEGIITGEGGPARLLSFAKVSESSTALETEKIVLQNVI